MHLAFIHKYPPTTVLHCNGTLLYSGTLLYGLQDRCQVNEDKQSSSSQPEQTIGTATKNSVFNNVTAVSDCTPTAGLQEIKSSNAVKQSEAPKKE